MESKPFCVPLACPVMHVGHASCWWQLSGCCSFVSHSTGPGPLAFYALRATHRCVGRKCSPAPGTQAALDARAAQTEPLALLAAVTWQHAPGPGEGGSCSEAVMTRTPQVLTPGRESLKTKAHPQNSLGPQEGR